MPSLRPLYAAIRLAIACLILAIGLRTWLVMGLIDPVTVAGSSMVPALQGGDRLWVDRTALLWRQPERWEVVVARNPSDAAELCIKRIVGLSGERVALRDGNVLIDGAVVVKSRDERHDLRVLIHDEEASDRRWRTDEATAWQFNKNVWQHDPQPSDAMGWLHYQHPRAQPVTDDVTYNVGLTRKLNLVDEFMLSAEVRLRGEGSLSLAIDDGKSAAQVDLHLPDGEITLRESNRRGAVVRISSRSRERLARGKVRIEFSNFDQQLLLVIDGRVELRRPWHKTKATGTASPFSIGAQGLDVRLGGLTLYRDIYHSSHAASTPPRATQWQLGPDEYFLLGDNAPISLDSRLWGPVPAHLLVGRPLVGGR